MVQYINRYSNKDMIEKLIEIDQDIFILINQGLSNAFFDWLLPIMRNPYTWTPLYLFLIIFFIKHYGKMGILVVCMTLVNIGITDVVSSHLIKKSVQRIRPCNDHEFKDEINLRVRCGGDYSFTSSHATNHYGMAFFWIVLFRRRWHHTLWLCIAWASIIAFSQVYVGVHYPFDVTCGALLGTGIGLLNGYLFKRFFPIFFNDDKQSSLAS